MRILLLLLLALPVAAQPVPGPGVAIMVHHPYPDDADPFGFPLDDRDPFMSRFRHLDENGDGFDFPSLVVDGVVLVESVPDGNPQEATTQAYMDAVASRRDEAGIELTVFALVQNGTLDVMVQADPRVPMNPLHLWVGIVEDGVYFEPPPALSNGIYVHPFTTRAIVDVGLQNMSAQVRHRESFAVEGWNVENTYAVVWFQAGAGHTLRYAAHEVAQATMHPVLATSPTLQQSKGVLVEAYSATWCKPCLFGDRAVDELATVHGLPLARDAQSSSYIAWPAPSVLVAAIVLALLGAWLGARR